jgi:general secretion pathway protein H
MQTLATGNKRPAAGVSAAASGRFDASASGCIDASASGCIDASASGRIDASASGRIDASASGGFTLIELMIVIVIIGLASAAVMLTGFGGPPPARKAAETLAARLVGARDLAIASGEETALVIEAGGYRFERRGGGAAWQQMPGGDRWPEGMAVSAEIEGGGRMRFDATGLATPGVVQLGAAGAGAGARVQVGAAGDVHVDAP